MISESQICCNNNNKYVKRNCEGTENLSFIHSNIRSIPANLNAFMSYMSNINCDFSVIGFSETWLNSSNIDTYSIDGYRHVGLTRETGKGGGVSLFICDSIMYCELPEFNMVCEYIECVFVKLNCMGHNFIVGVVYRAPNSNISDFNDSIHDILEKVFNKISRFKIQDFYWHNSTRAQFYQKEQNNIKHTCIKTFTKP